MEQRASRKPSSSTSTRIRRLGATQWTRGTALLAAAALLTGGTLAAAPARAGDFEDGFEDQLGRIAAVSVVRFGTVLAQGAIQGHRQRHVPVVHAPQGHFHPDSHFDSHPQPHRDPGPTHPYPASYSADHGHPHGRFAHAPAYHGRPVPAPRPAAYPGPPPSLWAESDDHQVPCQHRAAAPYGEHIVYERYERTVTAPPQAAPAPAPRHITY